MLVGMTPEHIWHVHPHAASIGFHVLHAIGQSRSVVHVCARRGALGGAASGTRRRGSAPNPQVTASELMAAFEAAVERALDQLRGPTRRRSPRRARSVARGCRQR